MSKQSLLLVDGDTRSLRVLEVSLRKAGFTVTPAASVSDALDKLELHTPDLIISETKFPTDLDGFELRRRVRGAPDWAEIPFVFLTAETAIEHKIRGLELGVDDYLTKPIYIKEIVTRINILLQKRQRAHFDERKDGVRFGGRVADMPVVDVIQTIEISRKSGVIQFVGNHDRQAAIYFRDGKVIDAEAGTLQGEDAVYRLLTWSDGEFEVVFRTVRRREAITTSSQGLLMEGMRRLDEWSRLLEQLPPLSHRFEIDTPELSARLGEVPDDNNLILRLIDGKRSLLEVIDASDFGDLECLQAVSKLFFEGLLMDLDPDQRPRRDSGRFTPLLIVESAPTPIEEVASGPIFEDVRVEAESIDDAPPEVITIPEPPPQTQPVHADAVMSEVAVEPEPEPEPEPGPLMGGYRPSSLRLIDEAVAAAQAIDPSLFESEFGISPGPANETPSARIARVQLGTRESDPRVVNARGLIERTAVEPTNGEAHEPVSSRAKTKSLQPMVAQTAIERAIARADASGEIALPQPEDDTSGVPTAIEPELPDEGPTSPDRRPFAPRKEESSLRMIGSHGRDRAEASGELNPNRAPVSAPMPDAQRELVTIMPRRVTRELVVPAVEPEALEAESVVEPETRELLPPPPRISVAGGVRRRSGPGIGAKILLVTASVMAGLAVYMYFHPHKSGSTDDEGGAPALHHDAGAQLAEAIDAKSEPRIVAPIDDANEHARPDANRIAMVDAGAPVVIPSGSGTSAGSGDRVSEARILLEQAHAALEDGDPAKALDLTNQSLELRKTSRTYLERARALQRLGQIDEALKSVDESMTIVNDFAPAWEQRGMILWAARRQAEARPALEKYLALDPDGKDAPEIRKMLGQP